MKKSIAIVLVLAAGFFAWRTFFGASSALGDGLSWRAGADDVRAHVDGLSVSDTNPNILVKDVRWLEFSAHRAYQIRDGALFSVSTTVTDGPSNLCDRAKKYVDGEKGWTTGADVREVFGDNLSQASWHRIAGDTESFLICSAPLGAAKTAKLVHVKAGGPRVAR